MIASFFIFLEKEEFPSKSKIKSQFSCIVYFKVMQQFFIVHVDILICRILCGDGAQKKVSEHESFSRSVMC